jgi:hypothetical protein
MTETAGLTQESDIAAARAAWQRLRNERQTFNDWVLIGRALAIGRAVCMHQAKANKPHGYAYNRMMGAWLKANGLDGISNQERYRAVLVVENLAAIELWREALPEEKRRRFNHPGAVWAHWQRTQKPARAGVQAAQSTVAGKLPERPSGDMLRRISKALHEARSRDYIVLAEAAYMAVRMADMEAAALARPIAKTAPLTAKARPKKPRHEAHQAPQFIPA